MRHLEAEKLLGGYAAGILTEAEKTALFRAALEHQELFDALANEEALRELLADPATRSHLLALLDEPRIRRPIPFWRRPATLGLAASLLLMVTTSLVLWQREQPVAPAPSTSKVDSKAPSPIPPPLGASSAKQVVKEPTSEAAPTHGKGTGTRETQALAQRPAEPSPAAPLMMEAEAPPTDRAKAKKHLAEAPRAEVIAERVAAAATPENHETKAASHFTRADRSSRSVQGAASPKVIRPGILTADRSTNPLKTLAREITAKLNEATLAAVLSRLPKDCVLELRIDTAGRVIGAAFNKPFPGSGHALELIQGWRFEDWNETGPTNLSVPLMTE